MTGRPASPGPALSGPRGGRTVRGVSVASAETARPVKVENVRPAKVEAAHRAVDVTATSRVLPVRKKRRE